MNFEVTVNAYVKHIHGLVSQNSQLEPYFVTTVITDTNYDQNNDISRRSRHVFKEYDRFYRHLTSNLMNNFSKKPHLHPRTFDFLDLQGTRRTNSVHPDLLGNPHVHSVYLIHPETHKRFQTLRADRFSQIVRHTAMRSIISVQAEPIDMSTLSNVVSYSAKLLRSRAIVAAWEDVELFTQYPLADFERRQRQRDIAHALSTDSENHFRRYTGSSPKRIDNSELEFNCALQRLKESKQDKDRKLANAQPFLDWK